MAACLSFIGLLRVLLALFLGLALPSCLAVESRVVCVQDRVMERSEASLLDDRLKSETLEQCWLKFWECHDRNSSESFREALKHAGYFLSHPDCEEHLYGSQIAAGAAYCSLYLIEPVATDSGEACDLFERWDRALGMLHRARELAHVCERLDRFETGIRTIYDAQQIKQLIDRGYHDLFALTDFLLGCRKEYVEAESTDSDAAAIIAMRRAVEIYERLRKEKSSWNKEIVERRLRQSRGQLRKIERNSHER